MGHILYYKWYIVNDYSTSSKTAFPTDRTILEDLLRQATYIAKCYIVDILPLRFELRALHFSRLFLVFHEIFLRLVRSRLQAPPEIPPREKSRGFFCVTCSGD